ncbi:uncharacterized protein LOC115599918 [Calypte anna]|uniref:uncharacterized protein LOC115599918 n=1 Tax=Calypte anna TaxID=9244 RepID=UPI0011C3C2D4|nr:uncharacterized protein LOC115599918 [Calypte anna]
MTRKSTDRTEGTKVGRQQCEVDCPSPLPELSSGTSCLLLLPGCGREAVRHPLPPSQTADPWGRDPPGPPSPRFCPYPVALAFHPTPLIPRLGPVPGLAWPPPLRSYRRRPCRELPPELPSVGRKAGPRSHGAVPQLRLCCSRVGQGSARRASLFLEDEGFQEAKRKAPSLSGNGVWETDGTRDLGGGELMSEDWKLPDNTAVRMPVKSRSHLLLLWKQRSNATI